MRKAGGGGGRLLTFCYSNSCGFFLGRVIIFQASPTFGGYWEVTALFCVSVRRHGVIGSSDSTVACCLGLAFRIACSGLRLESLIPTFFSLCFLFGGQRDNFWKRLSILETKK